MSQLGGARSWLERRKHSIQEVYQKVVYLQENVIIYKKKKTFSYTNRNLMGTPQVNKKQKARCSNLYKVVF